MSSSSVTGRLRLRADGGEHIRDMSFLCSRDGDRARDGGVLDVRRHEEDSVDASVEWGDTDERWAWAEEGSANCGGKVNGSTICRQMD